MQIDDDSRLGHKRQSPRVYKGIVCMEKDSNIKNINRCNLFDFPFNTCHIFQNFDNEKR